MEEINKNKNQNKLSKNRFLKDDGYKKSLAQEHKEYLGLGVPDDYFSESKDTILKSLPVEKVQKRTIFGLKPFISYPIAATILLLIALTFWFQTDDNQNNLKVTDIDAVEILNNSDLSDDFLVSSLFVDDVAIEKFMDDYILNEIIVEAERSEQQLENIFINSIFIEDSLIGNYMDKHLIENIIL